jgi:transcriptional regulator with XRE-family HTH domain
MSSKRATPELCLAVKRTREAFKLSQELFAREIATTATTISRIERGLQTPGGFDLLNRLEAAARQRGMAEEAELFHQARSAVRFQAYRQAPLSHERQDITPDYPLPKWRLLVALRLGLIYFPDEIPAVEAALHSPLQIVDEILRSTNENHIDFRHMEREIFARAERKKLQELKGDQKR